MSPCEAAAAGNNGVYEHHADEMSRKHSSASALDQKIQTNFNEWQSKDRQPVKRENQDQHKGMPFMGSVGRTHMQAHSDVEFVILINQDRAPRQIPKG